MPAKRTHKEYKKEIKDRQIKVLEKYINSKIKILHRCEQCGKKWKTRPGDILRGHGCPRCSHTKTHEEYVDELSDKPIEVLGTLNGVHNKILHKCEKCGLEWLANPADLLYHNSGCPKCYIEGKPKTHEEYQEEISARQIKVVESYKGDKTGILHKCEICNYKWKTMPRSILQGAGCPQCERRKKTKSHEDYVEEIADYPFEVLEEYQGAHTKILHKCNKCELEWKARPNDTQQGVGCPKCALSKGELRIEGILESIGVKYEREYKIDGCRFKNPLPFDFAILDNDGNVRRLIEYNGRQHYKPIEYFGGEGAFESQMKRDTVKQEYCQENDIPLTVIPYTEGDILDEVVKGEI